MATTPWWREFFEDIFPKPEAYKPKDRTLSQLQHIHNSDTASEAVDDYRAEREEAEASLQQARYEHLEAYTKKLVAEAERLGEMKAWEEAKAIVEEWTPSELGSDEYDEDAECSYCRSSDPDCGCEASEALGKTIQLKFDAKLTELKAP